MNAVASLIVSTDLTSAERRRLKNQRKSVLELIGTVHQLHEEINSCLRKSPASERPIITSPANAADILRPFIAHLDHEELWVLVLDRRNRVVNIVKLYVGSVNSSQVRVAEVFRQAIIENGSSILIGHNHPSDDPTPSPDDVSVTRAIREAGKLLDIELLDHVIVTTDRYVSLKERGLGFS